VCVYIYIYIYIYTYMAHQFMVGTQGTYGYNVELYGWFVDLADMQNTLILREYSNGQDRRLNTTRCCKYIPFP